MAYEKQWRVRAHAREPSNGKANHPIESRVKQEFHSIYRRIDSHHFCARQFHSDERLAASGASAALTSLQECVESTHPFSSYEMALRTGKWYN